MRLTSFAAAAMALFLMCAASTLHAELPLEPTVPYKAEGEMSFEGRMVPHAIWYDHEKIRLEFVTNARRQVIIMRKDLGRMYMFVANESEGTEMVLDPAQASPHGAFHGLSLTAEDTETLAGMEAVRYRVEGKDILGRDTSGQLWLTEEGIMLRTEMTTSVGDRSDTTRIVFSEVEIGPLPESLFEVPEGVSLTTLN